MKNLLNSLKNMLDGDQDPRMSAIKKAMRSLGYDCEVGDDKKYAFCQLPADNSLRYKSRVLLRPQDEGITLRYTIYAKRIRHDAPLQDPKSKAALKGYHYQSGADELMIWKELPQDITKPKDLAEAIQQIRATALAVYTDAGIPEDPDETIDFNGVSAKTIKDKLRLYKCFKEIHVSEERVYTEAEANSTKGGDFLWGFGIDFRHNKSGGIDCKFYYNTIALPQEPTEKLADRFAHSFGLKGRLAYEPMEASFTITPNTLSGQLVEKYIDLMMDAIRDLWSDIDQSVVEVYNRAIKEAERQKATAEAKAREEARQRKLNKGYTLTLRGGTTIRNLSPFFRTTFRKRVRLRQSCRREKNASATRDSCCETSCATTSSDRGGCIVSAGLFASPSHSPSLRSRSSSTRVLRFSRFRSAERLSERITVSTHEQPW